MFNLGFFWRRERDSNPRTVARNTISSRARSTTPPSLRFQIIKFFRVGGRAAFVVPKYEVLTTPPSLRFQIIKFFRAGGRAASVVPKHEGLTTPLSKQHKYNIKLIKKNQVFLYPIINSKEILLTLYQIKTIILLTIG